MSKMRLLIHGKVQGVFYRQSALETGSSLGLSGWIKNNPDGSVEAEVLGSAAQVQSFVNWCRKGPPHARVEAVTTLSHDPDHELDEASKGTARFVIEH